MKGFQKGDPRARAAGARGGVISGQRRWRMALAKIKAVWPNIPIAAQHAIYAYGESRMRTGLTSRSRLDKLG